MARSPIIRSVLTIGSLLSSPALAVDGVLEINQTCAVETGCFPGDPPGFPVLITGLAGNSYRLTSNLAVGLGNADTDGIFINTSRVTIDFNGFTLNGPSLGAVPGTGTGIAVRGGAASGSAPSWSTLRNGSIRGWQGAAIAIPEAVGVRVEDMVFQFNEGSAIEVGADAQILGNRITPGNAVAPRGITAGDRSRIERNVVSGMQADGIFCTDACTVSGNTTSSNGETGIQVASDAVVSGNTSHGNSISGIIVQQNARVVDNTISNNDSNGVQAGGGAAISGNVAADNGRSGIRCASGAVVAGNVARGNGIHGIETGDRSSVRGNTVLLNGSYGLDLGGGRTAYAGNTIDAPTSSPGTVSGGTDTGGNLCNGSTVCP